jgi:hypothetical protein
MIVAYRKRFKDIHRPKSKVFHPSSLISVGLKSYTLMFMSELFQCLSNFIITCFYPLPQLSKTTILEGL